MIWWCLLAPKNLRRGVRFWVIDENVIPLQGEIQGAWQHCNPLVYMYMIPHRLAGDVQCTHVLYMYCTSHCVGDKIQPCLSGLALDIILINCYKELPIHCVAGVIFYRSIRFLVWESYLNMKGTVPGLVHIWSPNSPKKCSVCRILVFMSMECPSGI